MRYSDGCLSPLLTRWFPSRLQYMLTLWFLKVIGNVYDSSNWVEHTYPGALYLCIKYIDDPELSMTASVNLGGDSSNRTALIGAVMGNTTRSISFLRIQPV